MYADIDKDVICRLGFLTISNMDFLGQCEQSWVGEAHEKRIATVTLQKEIYLFKLPAIRHSRHHLCQLLLLALQHPVHMLHWNLRTGPTYERNGPQKER